MWTLWVQVLRPWGFALVGRVWFQADWELVLFHGALAILVGSSRGNSGALPDRGACFCLEAEFCFSLPGSAAAACHLSSRPLVLSLLGAHQLLWERPSGGQAPLSGADSSSGRLAFLACSFSGWWGCWLSFGAPAQAPCGSTLLMPGTRFPTAVITVCSDVADSPSCVSRALSPQWGPGTLGHEVKMCEWGVHSKGQTSQWPWTEEKLAECFHTPHCKRPVRNHRLVSFGVRSKNIHSHTMGVKRLLSSYVLVWGWACVFQPIRCWSTQDNHPSWISRY